MGWFSWGNKAQDISEPSRQNRQKCWETRDSYFDCLDRANIIKPGDEGNSCAKEKQLYEDNCAKSWITYFNQRRVLADAQKDRLAQAQAQADSARK
ncbi:hypothetical protein AGABI2DRAFT_66754 [Agaricus bisporus var. bisporus H97]|uniref:hypothetical protein n=1 Tax=Agaricus bisporus var. bisporus (strain H97 / ATCC MYA-4626 / FGSC 10389) TaxID=936046 RepID=UPI00029F7DDC|nr:hypothetical protein AGABI2DRAFT_66754 [Agaricus bisporus var. bisporus H97]EKV48863.1 hypothetical protein AGABI2DRAFT_66754 [Agaricus bisporus var. bisporus H97]